ncbi:MAG: hypothetical protein H6821_09150 [Planctomycetaceae bacterium]|nr:hypothetical protein [Planctomycetales bacterium]MCB9874330.1 hypothetical protein [Planctomycetaceae bacterium]MCB9941541.1 hypothetical protein [Planctomycetaceae bacterium]
MITADCGGSNNHRTRLWRWTLQRSASESGLKTELCQDPPGSSKWNKIEDRLLCHITRNWQDVPFESHEVVATLIGSTSTTTVHEVHA